MKKTGLFIAVILLAGSIIHTSILFAQINDPKSEEKLVLASFTLVKPLPKVPERMMVYKTLAPNITRQDIMTMMKAFKLEGEIDDRERQFIVKNDDRMLEVYKQTGTGFLRYGDDAKLGIEKQAENLPSEDIAVARAKEFLRSHDLLPENTFLNGTGYYQFTKYSSKGEVIMEGKSAIAVGFGFMINEFKVEGPGAKAGVVFGDNGEIIGASRIWREIKADVEKEIITPDQAFAIFKKKWPQEAEPGQFKQANIRTEVIIKNVYLAYYANPGIEVQEYIEPVYMFKGEFKTIRIVEGKEYDERDYFVISVPALPEE